MNTYQVNQEGFYGDFGGAYIPEIRKHSDKCIFHSLRFGCSFAVANTIKPELL